MVSEFRKIFRGIRNAFRFDRIFQHTLSFLLIGLLGTVYATYLLLNVARLLPCEKGKKRERHT